MSVQFVFGRSGAGKTEYLMREFLLHAPEDFTKPWFLMVPEQDTLGMQRRMLSHPANSGRGMLNIDVLSFQRLSYRVFEELNMAVPRIIDDAGKIMILRETAGKVAGKLSLYKRQLSRPGFLDELKSQISEFYQYRISPEMLEMAAERAGSPYVRAKLSDLSVLFRAFLEYMDAHGYMAQEELLDRLFQYLPDTTLLRNAVLAFDGFTGFTPVQMDILDEMMRVSDRMLFALDFRGPAALAYEKRSPEDLFYLTRQTASGIVELAKKSGTALLPAVDMNTFDAVSGEKRPADAPLPRFRNAPALDFLGRILYSPGVGRSLSSIAARKNLELWEAPDRQAEAEAIAAEIARSVREKGLRYQDIGVIITDPEGYRDLVYKAFSEAEIPYFFDDPGSLLDTPYAEVIRSALEVVDRNFSFESVLRFLRSLPGREPEEDAEIDIIDNYLREKGIRGYTAFSSDWGEYEALRQKYLLPLIRMRESTEKRGEKIAVRVEALRALLSEISVREILEREADRLRNSGFAGEGEKRPLLEANLAEELIRSMEAVDEILGRLSGLLGETGVSRQEFRDILDAGLSEASIRRIPATLDQVIIGDLTRSRFSSPTLFFIAGVTADQIPKAESGQKILGDRERVLFRELEIELAPDRAENALIQRYYIYRALLNPSSRLILSWPIRGRDGKGLRPSGLVSDIRKLFPGLFIRRLRFALKEPGRPNDGAGKRQGEISDRAKGITVPMYDGDMSMQEKISDKAKTITGPMHDGAMGGQGVISDSTKSIKEQPYDWTWSLQGEFSALIKEVHTGQEALRYAARRMQDMLRGEDGTAFLCLAVLFRSEKYKEKAERLLQAAFTRYAGGRLEEEAARELYGEILTGSITRLELFRRCAFAHFLKYGLGLTERKTHEIQAFDIGNLYHAAIEGIFRKAADERSGLSDYSPEELAELSEACVREAADSYAGQKMTDTARSRYLVRKAEEVSRTTALVLREQLSRGDFRVAGLEKSFRVFSEDMLLNGRIDRTDICVDGERVYVRVIDYKSGRTVFDLEKVYEGLQLQLAAYMGAALREYGIIYPDKEVLPAAMLYYRLADPVLDYEEGRDAEEAFRERLKLLRPDGLVNSDPEIIRHMDRGIEKESEVVPAFMKDGSPDRRKKSMADTKRFLALQRYAEKKMQKYAESIRRGDIAIEPAQESPKSSACDYCPYHAVCRFDPRTEGFHYRTGEALDTEEIWRRIESMDGPEDPPGNL